MSNRKNANGRRRIGANAVADVTRALERAAERARETAVRTGTPLVVYRNGRMEKIAMTGVRHSTGD